MVQRFLKLAAPVFLLFIGFSISLHAQTSLGQIDGTVTDATGAIIPGAAITITNAGTGAVHTATSGDNGFFVVTNLPIGDYSVQVAKTGYGPVEQTGLSVIADAHRSGGHTSELPSLR